MDIDELVRKLERLRKIWDLYPQGNSEYLIGKKDGLDICKRGLDEFLEEWNEP